MLHEYGFVHPRLQAMPKNRARFIIATHQGERVDWPVTIADSLRVPIQSVVDGKKVWTAVAQWLTLLAPPVQAIKAKKQARTTETTPVTDKL